MPFFGKVNIAYIPKKDHLLGLSKTVYYFPCVHFVFPNLVFS
ncbi:MAG: hypothetical protein ACI4PI_01445 [Oscillospiraceae bacterium]